MNRKDELILKVRPPAKRARSCEKSNLQFNNRIVKLKERMDENVNFKKILFNEK